MLLWADGFDHYGSNETNTLDGVYAQNGQILSTTNVATGTHCLLVNGSGVQLRKVLPASTDKMGAMARFYFPALPVVDDDLHIFRFMTDSSSANHVSVSVDANGCLRFFRNHVGLSSPGTLIAQSDPIVVASAHNHIEVQVYIHDTLGWVRAAINGVHRYEATGLDTRHAAANIASVSHLKWTNTPGVADEYYMDDLIYYDFTGTAATDTDFCPTVDGAGIATNYIGELQCMYLPPNGNTAEDDWLKSTGTSAFALVDETTPDDTDYIYSTAVDDLTELSLTDLPEEITYIRGLVVLGRLSKSDSGATMVKYGMKSVAATTDAAERPVTVEPTYWWDFINVDPNTSARWTRASLNAAWLRLIRSV